MINLIPPRAKKALLAEYWVRVVSVWLILIGLTLLVGALLLVPVNVLIGSQIAIYQESSDVATENVLSYENVSSLLVQSSQQARFVIDESELPTMSDFVELFQSLENSEVEIYQMKFSRGKEGMLPATLSGVATDRQSLASFRDQMTAKEEILDVDLPISNLAQDKDIQFTITVTLNNQTDV